MRRLELLDGMRGYFLVFMVLNHLSFAGGYLLVKINHGELGYVQDAQGFVFLSGLLVGMVYSGRMRKQGYATGAAKIYRRAFEIYRYALLCLIAIFVLGYLLPQSRTFWEPWLWSLAAHDMAYAAAAAALVFQPTYMDILPQYIVYMLAAPPLIWWCLEGKWMRVAAISAVLWLAVQLGLHYPLADGIHGLFGLVYDADLFRAAFNVLAWQVVFMSGMVLGVLTLTGRIDWQKVFAPERTTLVWTALAVVLIFMAYRLGFTFGMIPKDVAERFGALNNRTDFSLVYLVNFAATGYLIAWTIMAGAGSRFMVPRVANQVLRSLFSLSFLRLIGRHSLQVYAWHVFVIYLLKAVEHHYGPYVEWQKTLIAVLAVASLALPALYREREKFFRRAPAGA